MLRRLSAFTTDPAGGNPAGVWLGTSLPTAGEMQRIARDVGYSETTFLAEREDGRFDTRYYSTEAEVSFCGHATIASGVLLGHVIGQGTYELVTTIGDVPVAVRREGEHFVASLTSVAPTHVPAGDELRDAALSALGWRRDELDDAIPPGVAYAGAHHLVLAAASRDRLDRLDYDFGRLREIMLGADLTTLQLIWRERDDRFHARNPFPVGGVVEDPATGAAAAALGGYLRDAGLLVAPASFQIRQGEAMGRPSRLIVDVPESGGITVSGAAVPLDPPA